MIRKSTGCKSGNTRSSLERVIKSWVCRPLDLLRNLHQTRRKFSTLKNILITTVRITINSRMSIRRTKRMRNPARTILKSRTKNGKIYLSLKGIITNWTRIFKISTKIVSKLISANSYLWPKQCKYQNSMTKDSLKIRGSSKIRSTSILSRRARGTEHRFFCSGMRKSLEFNQDTLTSNSTPNWASTA